MSAWVKENFKKLRAKRKHKTHLGHENIITNIPLSVLTADSFPTQHNTSRSIKNPALNRETQLACLNAFANKENERVL